MPFDGGLNQGRFEAIEKLDRVVDLLATADRWCKGALVTREGRRCIVGAMQAVGAVGVLRRPVLTAIQEVTGRPYMSIEFFNDCASTTHGLVLDVLARARADLMSGTVAWEAPPPPPRGLRARLGTLLRLARVPA